MRKIHTAISGSLAALMLVGLASGAALADSAGASFSTTDAYTSTDGGQLFHTLCQACHMDKGQGAVGAGKYPALDKSNETIASGGYVATIIIKGQKGMPPVGTTQDLSDEQVAAIVNYVRSNFGNAYDDKVSAEDVKELR